MFRPKGMDRVAHTRARDRARWLVRDHGVAAEAVLAAKSRRPGNTRADRAFYRMIRRELRMLRRHEAEAAPSEAGWFERLLVLVRGDRRPQR
jgi:hypothetical protein